MTPHNASIDQIQGRLNYREISWLASRAGDDEVKFTPKDGRRLYVFWDRGQGSGVSLDDILEFLGSDQH